MLNAAETMRAESEVAEWLSTDSSICGRVEVQSHRCLAAYQANPILVDEHANIERATAQGGYGRRQIYELVQNAADALIGYAGGRVHVLLTDRALYCANEGRPIDSDGVDAILSSHLSVKRGSEIGRFGLGFKSVLVVCDCPQFFSRSGSFIFDADFAAREIRAVKPDAERVPVLRIAMPVDPTVASEDDPVLRTLMEWATTVVKLPRVATESAWLSEDISTFPGEFLLFSSHVGELTLEDRTSGYIRRIEVTASGDEIRLKDGDNVTRWKVFQTEHRPSAAARKDAGELAERDALPLIWAVPLQGRLARGRFWAFFPTEYETTLSGILNAPWKTNEDRQNLLTGTFNEELIEAGVGLVVDSLAALVDDHDPARYLELVPARGREAATWADRLLTERFYEVAPAFPSVPDQKGILRIPSELQLHPAGVSREVLGKWSDFSGRPVDWCHPSVETRERRSRAERLVGNDGSSISTWLGALIHAPSPEASVAALNVAALLLDDPSGRHWTEEIRNIPFVLTAAGTLVAPIPGTVFIGSAIHKKDQLPLLPLVHPRVTVGAEAALRAFGIGDLDSASDLEALLHAEDEPDWAHLWELVDNVQEAKAMSLLQDAKARGLRIRVRTLTGKFRGLHEALLPGPIVPADGSRDSGVVIDTEFHRGHIGVLASIGALSAPAPNWDMTDEPWFGTYRGQAVSQYYLTLTASSQPQEGYLNFDRDRSIGPLDLLRHLSDEGRAKYSEALLNATEFLGPWRMRHDTRTDVYAPMLWEPPVIWMVKREGRLSTTLGNRPVDQTVGPQLDEWGGLFPVASCNPEIAGKLGLAGSLQDIPKDKWDRAMLAAEQLTDDRLIARFYAKACTVVEPPTVLMCRNGELVEPRRPETILVTTNAAEMAALIDAAEPALFLDDPADAQDLITNWNLADAKAAVRTEIEATLSGSTIALADQFPLLRVWLRDEHQDLTLAPASTVATAILTDSGKKLEYTDFVVEKATIYFSDRLSSAELLNRVIDVLHLPINEEVRGEILGSYEDEQRRQRLASVRSKPSLAERLLEAVGVSSIRRRLPQGLIAALEEREADPPDLRFAEVALAVYGVETLHEFRMELESEGFDVPQRWAGTKNAREFVERLGFPKQYAGFEDARRDPVLEVEGPPLLPQLHQFQERITANVRRLLVASEGKRGLLSLPTGSGKTRILVDAVVRAVRDDGFSGPLLWVAQSDELCEQAVQTWSYAWRSLGPQQSLNVSRLWGPNQAYEIDGGTQLVVATIDKLGGCIDDPEYQWLANATCVIVDEAHESITPSYTNLFSWLGLGRGNDRCALIGLTATPFRGSEEETRRLVNRYFGKRLDDGVLGDDPYLQLQEMGVLANVDHALLEGINVELTEPELKELRQTTRLPASASDRIGANVSRNEALLISIKSLPADWPVLLFATSVDHAKTMAALLSMEGISAAAVAGDTLSGARRHYIEAFKRGELRVLTNYGVLTAGFDAPAVRALYVARPTYSPVLYQQMIGRGLRGPLNGGKPKCLIVNVQDNIAQYGQELAFRQFEYLWHQ